MLLRAVLRRLLRLVPTLFVVTLGSFLLVNLLPGDPALQVVGVQYATDENLAEAREELGLDEPVLERYVDWLGGAVQGDLGRSYRSNRPVWDSIVERLPVSIELLLLAQGVAVLGALVIAPIAATRAGSLLDRISGAGVAAGLSTPPFILGLLLIFLFAVRWNVFRATGYVPLSSSVGENVRSMVLPTVTLTLVPMAIYVQALRTEMINVLQEDYVTLARGRGLSSSYVLFRHVLRPSSLPLMTLVGINVGALLGGAVLIEQIFSLPGLGRLTIDAINADDYILVQGIIVFITVAYVLVNFVVDLLYTVVDPRIRTAPP